MYILLITLLLVTKGGSRLALEFGSLDRRLLAPRTASARPLRNDNDNDKAATTTTTTATTRCTQTFKSNL